MSRAWKIYTGNPVDPSCCTLQSGLPSPLSLLTVKSATLLPGHPATRPPFPNAPLFLEAATTHPNALQ
jgi:hypothetical protein